ncbi:hypothetical protein AB3X91_37935 [Paraburkholderia sp. BR14263]|uniref:hypothetical protein n=1 Tax=unclassified Paraburkholderia TaxID=2615204 RepID=UPI0034CDAA13
MSANELVAIRMLNNSLSKAEYWIRRHSATLRGEAGPSKGNGRFSSGLPDLRVDVFCILHESDPCFDPTGENLVATLDGLSVLASATETPEERCLDECEPLRHALSDMHMFRLFRDLCEHGIACNWEELVRIGEISVQISPGQTARLRRGA